MKLALASFALTVLTAHAAKISPKNIRGKAAKTIMASSRRLEEGNGDDAVDEFDFLADYKLKFVGCSNEVSMTNDDGETEYGVAMYRLCPDDGTCSDESTLGCSSGYGDYVVGLSTFVDAFLDNNNEDQGDDGNGEDFEVNRYSECAEWEVQNDDDKNEDDGAVYYIGPTCSGGNDIKLAVFDDEDCSTESASTFAEISNGWTLPYSTGGLVTTYCDSCTGYNDDGELEVSEVCKKTYEEAGKCESNMATVSDVNGMQTGYCEQIENIFPKSSSTSAGKVFGWIVFVLVVIGLVAYCMWWNNKKKASSNAGIMA